MEYYLKVLKNYANFNGRARRKEYWMFVLFHIIIFVVLEGLAIGLQSMIFGLILMVYALGTLIPALAVTIRRMHDVSKSGWFCLIPIYSLILAVTDSTPGANEYGPNPKEGAMAAA
jgi:uncharacterized membrane protein YhaH (DUF805 family)